MTNDDINNAVQVPNKNRVAIKQGNALPTNLAGGSTSHIPVVIITVMEVLKKLLRLLELKLIKPN